MFFPHPQVSGFRSQLSLLVACLLFLASAASSSAVLGDTLADLTKHRGKPAGQPEPNKALWLAEGDDGQLVYTVRFGPDGKSMAEGLKPARTGGRLNQAFALDFIKAQLAPFKNSKSLREPKIGEKYTFAGQAFTVAENEHVILDNERGYLIVWVRGSLPSVMVITPASLQ